MTQETSTVQFIENHLPALSAGEYNLKISQVLEINNQIKETYEQSKKFYIASERFTLPLQSVHSVFPPESTTGDYDTSLPHIVLNRSTLPWERNAESDRTVPWLALLLFHEEDKLENTEKLDLTAARSDSRLKFSDRFPAEPQEQNEQITIIKIPDYLLLSIIPTANELKLLAHVRHVKQIRGSEVEETELAVVIGNRLPKPGRNIVHLISLENYFQSQSSHPSPYFISLKTWEFQCQGYSSESSHRFKQSLTNLTSDKQGNTLRLPQKVVNEDAEKYLSQGYVPLHHHLRNSENTISWYRGPLLPGPNSITLPSTIFPAQTADRLLRYLTEIDMFDVSYAAAYQLGKLLALQDKTFSINLYNWKRQQAKSQQNSISQHLAVLFDNFTDSQTKMDLVPEKVKAWFAEIALLKNLPFNYLVPDPLILPQESIRFFWVDNTWLECLSHGALALGEKSTSTQAEKQRYIANKEKAFGQVFQRVVTGFLLRSAVVSEFPALNVKGFGKNRQQQLNVLRKDNLSDTVLMYLFEGEVRSVNLSLGAEILHFGLGRSQENLVKAIRHEAGKEVFLNEKSWKNRVCNILNIAELSQQLLLKELNASNFSLAMVESSPQVIFSLADEAK
ncbi:hypothetical protein [Nostoc sp. UHCC 0251]|uniref:hypothetical protein n=1 Tax=Nostoc sp. UHCC 0251 TaxID=3110240 RepID=UPI002B21C84A|nr:hypothetical protein [Nostoc sp. UHCC 0251]MEA5622216.1 hypothetical protein [Nostoc sp. UHCC 0251]